MPFLFNFKIKTPNCLKSVDIVNNMLYNIIIPIK